MGCNCKLTEAIVAIVIIIFTLVETGISKWIIIIAALVLLVHALTCKNCSINTNDIGKKKTTKTKKRKR